jgi:DNA-binding CsgD family transcriptional regulator
MVMVRPPIGPVTMSYTVKFRLSDAELDDLKFIADGASLSEALRRLIANEKKRLKRRK